MGLLEISRVTRLLVNIECPWSSVFPLVVIAGTTFIVNCSPRNKIQWILMMNQNTTIIARMYLKMLSARWWPFYSSLNVFNAGVSRKSSYQAGPLLYTNTAKFMNNASKWNMVVLVDFRGYHSTVDSRYLASVGGQNSRARVKWFSRYFARRPKLATSRIRVPHCDVCTS